MKKWMRILTAALMAITLVSCDNDDDGGEPEEFSLGDGYFIVNEGAFLASNTSLSFFDRSSGEVTNNVYQTANGVPIGDQSQSMTIFNDKGYLVVQGSSKLEVINVTSGKSEATITDDISSPRYFLGIDETKGYVSDWGNSGEVKVLDLSTNTVTSTIDVGLGPNEMLLTGTSAYVASSGGFGKDSTVMVINTSTDEVTDTLMTGYNPEAIVEDADGNLWVLCKGFATYDTEPPYGVLTSGNGSLVKFNSAHEKMLDLELPSFSISNLVIDNTGENILYIESNVVYKMATSATELPSEAFINQGYYGLTIDPETGELLAADAKNFTSSGTVDIYDASGTLTDSYTPGIAPNGFAFK